MEQWLLAAWKFLMSVKVNTESSFCPAAFVFLDTSAILVRQYILGDLQSKETPLSGYSRQKNGCNLRKTEIS